MSEKHTMLNKILAHLFNDIVKVEEKALAKGPFNELTITDMHTIEAIGYSTARNMSSIAHDLAVTVGTLTIAVNHLVKKGFVQRKRSSKDRRVVLVSLTPKGKDAFRYNVAFHEKMVQEVTDTLSEEELTIAVEALQKIDRYFQEEKKKLDM
jgi:DNA-binding MarR family transcriptional regulator